MAVRWVGGAAARLGGGLMTLTVSEISCVRVGGRLGVEDISKLVGGM